MNIERRHHETATETVGDPATAVDGLRAAVTRRPLHPQTRALLWGMRMSGGRPLHKQTLAEARVNWRRIVRACSTRVPLAMVRPVAIPGPGGDIPARLYIPRSRRSRSVLVWFHGGGFVLGNLDTADGICRALASRSGSAVLSIQYRRRPEHPFAALVEDCLAAVQWTAAHGAQLRIDPARIAVGGDSAGATLAALVAYECRGSAVDVCMQLLIYPATDLSGDVAPTRPNADTTFLTDDALQWLENMALQGIDRRDPRISPLRAPDLGGMPPTVMITAGWDHLQAQGLTYAEALLDAGVPVQVFDFPRQIHGFITFDAFLRDARWALDIAGEALARALYIHPMIRSGLNTVAQRNGAVGWRATVKTVEHNMAPAVATITQTHAFASVAAYVVADRIKEALDPRSPRQRSD